jgi:hypothetical protein
VAHHAATSLLRLTCVRPTPALHRTAGAAGELPRRWARSAVAGWVLLQVQPGRLHVTRWASLGEERR